MKIVNYFNFHTRRMNKGLNYDVLVGFSRLDIIPPLGTNIRGYFHQRMCEGILNSLEINTIVIKKDNGMFNDFDDVTRGYAHSRHIGNVVAGAIMSVYEKVEFIPCSEVKAVEEVIMVASNMPKPEDMEQARYIDKMHKEGRDAELPYKGMMLTTMVAEAGRMISLEHGPEFYPMNLTAIKIGGVAFLGIPGEPFAGIGIEIKKAEGWKIVCPTCITNGYKGYFPMKDSYDEGGYESRSSIYKAGVAETIIEESVKILDLLKR